MKAYFPEVKTKIGYEGPESDNPLAFRWYDPERRVGDRTMREHLRFAVAYWHTLKGGGADIFGSGTYRRPWNASADPMTAAGDTMRAAFEFFTKLGVDYYCFHDRDIAPEGEDFASSCRRLEQMVALAKQLQAETGVKLLWGTANLFSHPRYAHGAGTNPDFHTFAYACAQVRHAIDATVELGGENYVFWGGREGYETLLNTDYAREQEQFARFLRMAVDYKKKIGFTGTFLIEPKPKEPTRHQYDFDAATVLGFLRRFDLEAEFKLNIEANHATLAGHSFEHELTVAAAAGRLGSIDANVGDPLLGWDTDQFPTSIYDAVKAMLVVLKQGGLGSGGLNFDAKVRRGSTDQIDLFYAHIGAMDTFARALLLADRIIADGKFDALIAARYAGFDCELGRQAMTGRAGLAEMETFTAARGEPEMRSGRQEYLENLLNRYLIG